MRTASHVLGHHGRGRGRDHDHARGRGRDCGRGRVLSITAAVKKDGHG